MQIETNLDYLFPAETCYVILRDEVVSKFRLTYWFGYRLVRVPFGSIKLKVEEEESRALLMKVRTRFWGGGIVPQTIGPVLRIISKPTAETRCTVEMVAESTAYYNSQFANLFLDMMNHLNPAMLIYKFRGSPKVFFGDEVVYDHKSFEKTRASQDINIGAYKYIFSELHKRLAEKLKDL